MSSKQYSGVQPSTLGLKAANTRPTRRQQSTEPCAECWLAHCMSRETVYRYLRQATLPSPPVSRLPLRRRWNHASLTESRLSACQNGQGVVGKGLGKSVWTRRGRAVSMSQRSFENSRRPRNVTTWHGLAGAQSLKARGPPSRWGAYCCGAFAVRKQKTAAVPPGRTARRATDRRRTRRTSLERK
jgi:hypothetical protein